MLASIFSLVCCLILKDLPGSAFVRKLFSTSIGIFITFFCFGKSGLASLAVNLLSYLTMKLAPANSQHIIIFVVSGVMLAFSQIHKQIYSYGVNGLDVPVSMMFNFCRISSLACCLHDG